MNYEQKCTLYEEAKSSLKKFKGDDGGKKEKSAIKLEPAYLAENEGALLAAGYVKAKGKKFDSRRGPRWEPGGFVRNQSIGGAKKNFSPKSTTNIKMNPIGTDGRTLTCKCCGSFRHLLANCPDALGNKANVNVTEDEHAVLFTGYNKDEIARLGVDARKCAVLDSACSSTVCGKLWLDGYLKALDKEDQHKVYQTEGVKNFKFGGGTRLKSEGECSIPAVIAGKQVTIKTDVVSSDTPLLLSRTTMKNAGVKMDLEYDRAEIFGQNVALNLTSSGHYCIPIDKNEKITVETVCSVKLDDVDEAERHKILLKLHRQFAHPSKRRLMALLKDAGVWKNDYLDILSTIE